MEEDRERSKAVLPLQVGVVRHNDGKMEFEHTRQQMRLGGVISSGSKPKAESYLKTPRLLWGCYAAHKCVKSIVLSIYYALF